MLPICVGGPTARGRVLVLECMARVRGGGQRDRRLRRGRIPDGMEFSPPAVIVLAALPASPPRVLFALLSLRAHCPRRSCE